MSSEATLPCIACGKTLPRISETEDVPYGGTEFTTYGQYGSTFWDSFHGEQLIITVCDDCLRAHTERIWRQKRFRNLHVDRMMVGREFVHRMPVPWFDGPEDNDDVEIDLEDVGTLSEPGTEIEWHRDWPGMVMALQKTRDHRDLHAENGWPEARDSRCDYCNELDRTFGSGQAS